MTINKRIFKTNNIIKALSVAAFVFIFVDKIMSLLAYDFYTDQVYFAYLYLEHIIYMILDILPYTLFVLYICLFKEQGKWRGTVITVLLLRALYCIMRRYNPIPRVTLLLWDDDGSFMEIMDLIAFVFLIVSIVSIVKDTYSKLIPIVSLVLLTLISFFDFIQALLYRISHSFLTEKSILIYLFNDADFAALGALLLHIGFILYFINKKPDVEAKLINLCKKYNSKKITEEEYNKERAKLINQL